MVASLGVSYLNRVDRGQQLGWLTDGFILSDITANIY